eukprot:TRINITY_DN16459_c0_g1_i1.p1 TRINITY_DN16459_c0_g1~~TRINITY_DN16459_c0_g1_i1.p1  ORF type:complete len:361 (+),score=66.41 TRINITY_DN16459_c0_g1_i1:89-1171(+)
MIKPVDLMPGMRSSMERVLDIAFPNPEPTVEPSSPDEIAFETTVPEVSSRGEAIGWRHFKPSAGYDTTAVGAQALEGLVSMNGSASFTNLANAQAAKLRQIVEVAGIRAAEAERVVRFLRHDAEGTGQAGQIAGGVGFGLGKDVDEGRGSSGGDLADLAGGVASLASSFGGGKKGKKGGGGAGGLLGGLAATAGASSGGGNSNFDEQAFDIVEGLRTVILDSRKAIREAAKLADTIEDSARKSNKAVRIAADELNYPGFNADALIKPQPRVARQLPRPRDAAPAYLDFLYSAGKGADPYRLLSASPEGRELHNFFRSPPLPSPKASGAKSNASETTGALGALGAGGKKPGNLSDMAAKLL